MVRRAFAPRRRRPPVHGHRLGTIQWTHQLQIPQILRQLDRAFVTAELCVAGLMVAGVPVLVLAVLL